MRHFLLLGFIDLSIESTGRAQVAGTPSVPSTIFQSPVPGYGNSVLDHDGNLFVLDTTYSAALTAPAQPAALRLPISPKTRITIITNSGAKLASREYDGSLQVIGVGRNAVYAVVNTYSLAPSGSTERTEASSPSQGAPPAMVAFTTTRRLVALRAGAGGLPATLPGIEVPMRAEPKLAAAAVAGGLDMIALVDAAPMPRLLPAGVNPAAVEPRNARLYKSDGNAFMPVTPNPIPLP